ncbi:hypothetical protein FQA39_LY09644 [Lamprigera yunnana]|nr:hypothetical protein FQA39_LY09644 [Lamprigera yunnana]
MQRTIDSYFRVTPAAAPTKKQKEECEAGSSIQPNESQALNTGVSSSSLKPSDVFDSINSEEDLEKLADTQPIVSNEAEDSQNPMNSQHSTQEKAKEHGGNETQTEEYGNETRQETLPSIDLTCIVCLKETSGAHTCYKCNNNVHTICGVTQATEGFGSKLLCSICVNQINQEN